MTTNTAIKHIPLSQLTAWEGNARKTHTKEGIDELAASIKAHGLLQSLVVFQDGKSFAVVAGQRRLTALGLLHQAGDIGADFSVPCKVAEDVHAAEISLAENAVRENMHPADECDAYRGLVDKGQNVTDIAARFGKTEQYITQRLKLTKVSPQVIKAYKAGEINLEHVQAFAISDDHKAQNKVLEDFDAEYEDADNIRRQLTNDQVSADDKRVKYVTLKAYEKAGGGVKRDLFSDENENIILLDEALLDKLVEEKLAKVKATLEKEGWSWVESREKFEYGEKAKFTEMEQTQSPLSEKDAAKLKKLKAEYDKLEKEFEDADQDAEYPERLNEIDTEMEDINDARKSSWTPEQLAVAGAVVAIGHNGKSEISRGLVRAADKSKAKGLWGTGNVASCDEDAKEIEKPEFSQGLIEDLTCQRSAALSARLLTEPGIAQAAIAYTMALDTFEKYDGDYNCSCLSIKTNDSIPSRTEDTKAFAEITAARKKWSKILPKTPKALWKWCNEQDAQTLMELMAVCAAAAVNAMAHKSDGNDSERIQNADQLAKALKLDMAVYYTPTAENYFSRISKPQIVEALKEIGKANLLDEVKTKKGDAASFAEGQAKESGWLPAILRQKK